MAPPFGEAEIAHVFLPPRLPQSESDPSTDSNLIETVIAAIKALQKEMPTFAHAAVRSALFSVRTLRLSATGANIGPLLTGLRDGETLAIHVQTQNACVMVSREEVSREGTQLVFEQFELSPENKAVYSTPGRLVRCFPASAVAVDAGLIKDSDLTSTISDTLATMSIQDAPGMRPTSRKAGADHDEDRDTTQPAIISELFFGMLRGIGTSPAKMRSSITKNTREEVLWKNARRPWRRSPVWLLIRVMLQLTTSRVTGGSNAVYKNMMLFIMSYMLTSTENLALSSETFYVMQAKIDRRRQKLLDGGLLNDSVAAYVQSTLEPITNKLTCRWATLQAKDATDLREEMEILKDLDFEQDTQVSLPELDNYIHAVQSRHTLSSASEFKLLVGLLKFEKDELPSLPARMNDLYAAANLQQFERWVAFHLQTWLDSNPPDACKELCKLLKSYHTLAAGCYAQDPLQISTMLLTSMEIFVACDKAAVRSCNSNILANYDIDVPGVFLQNLLLPSLSQMKRLSAIEEHLKRRKQQSDFEGSLLFDAASNKSFACRYFDGSVAHQTLLRSIELRAEDDRQAKRDELRRVQAEYQRLDALYRQADCEYTTRVVDYHCDPPETETTHNSHCRKCSHKRKRDNLSIKVHEWPLPANSTAAKAVVFELSVPDWLVYWREARLYFLQHVLKGKCAKDKLRSQYELSKNDPQLKEYFKTVRHRVGLLSQEKPTVITHLGTKDKGIPSLSETDVCVASGLRYRYYDSGTQSFLGRFTFDNTIPKACTYTLPNQAQTLQRYLFRPASTCDGAPPNAVIANQQSCPANMSLEEFKELGCVPLGHRIQWANIDVQLAMPSVDFKKLETTLVFLQCIYQAGPPCSNGSPFRESHESLRSDAVAFSLEENLRLALGRVKENWESVQALNVFVAIATRVLTLNSSVTASLRSFLHSARKVALGWISTLRNKAHTAEDHNDRTDFVSRSVEVALACASTFDVDDEQLKAMLKSSENVTVLAWTAIVVQEGENALTKSKSHISMERLRFKRLLCRSYQLLAQNEAGIDGAVKMAWAAYSSGTHGWRSVKSTTHVADHWITTETAAAANGKGARVHFNLLTGELLVNGLPLDQPPRNYRDHPLFQTLFGNAIVEVMPASKNGFQFSTKRCFGGHQVQLAMHEGQLLVHATDRFGTTYETVPVSTLQNSYSQHFLTDFVLWLKPSEKVIEFRPREDPWNTQNSKKWTLSPSIIDETTRWQNTQDRTRLIGTQSQTGKTICKIFQPLAADSLIHCMVQSDGELLVEIPSLRLRFSVSRHDPVLRSLEYRSMIIDRDQSLGTLIGFSNKLMLRPQTGTDRMVMILASPKVDFSKQKDHILVKAEPHTDIKVYALRVDDCLKRLLHTDLECKLYLAYLHALTSFCLPDPLTYKTGTEEALSILRSKSTESFETLSQENIYLLGKIATLSPARQYYPAHKQDMQTVDWKDRLGFLAQHGDFSIIVEHLLSQARSTAIFFPEHKQEIPDPHSWNIEENLRQKDAIRSSAFRVDGFGAEHHTTAHDKPYASRDRGQGSPKSQVVASMSRLLARESDWLNWDAPSQTQLWNLFSARGTVYGPKKAVKKSDLRYNASLLSDGGRDYAMSMLPALHRWLSAEPTSQYLVTMWLSTLAFAGVDPVSLQVFAAFWKRTAQLAAIAAPDYATFAPMQGYSARKQDIKAAFNSERFDFSKSPEAKLVRQKNERAQPYYDRRKSAWQRASDAALSQMADEIFGQWPCLSPKPPTTANASTYFAVQAAMASIASKFEAWYRNSQLFSYLGQIHTAMSRLSRQTISLPIMQIQSSPRQISKKGFLSESDLFSEQAPSLPPPPPVLTAVETGEASATDRSKADPRLKNLVERLRSVASKSSHEAAYVQELEHSLQSLLSKDDLKKPVADVLEKTLEDYLRNCKDHAMQVANILTMALCSEPKAEGAHAVFHMPRLSPTLLLKQLARDRWRHLSTTWQECIVKYALALTALQRAERLLMLTHPSRKEDFLKEQCNSGHINWDLMQFPETLLMEVESGFLVREVQEQIAQEMRKPSTGKNAVMQLNMGEGKSSVIVPMAAANLANSSQLVRVIVAKPQSKQMAQMLISKLGGLVNRRVYYMPFSRSLHLTRDTVSGVSAMLRECTETGGILLVQPEHILSFKLMGLGCYIDGMGDVGRALIATQDFLDSFSRDIVDESDENFSTRFELIYTMGAQRSVELSPDRWFLVQQVLELVALVAPDIAKEFPGAIDITTGKDGSFSRIRILRPEAGERLVALLGSWICERGLDGFHLSRQSAAVRTAVTAYMTKSSPADRDIELVEKSPIWDEASRSHLLMLRGLLAEGVLLFTLGQKRWRVNFGLAARTPPTALAVPYRAKDSPSPRSEFSHPDVVITLTSLAYYYGSLDDEDMFTAFGHLAESDEATTEYQRWVKDSHDLPVAFQQLQSINLKDRSQCVNELFSCLRHGKSVVDYFLSHIVFPKEMKEFPHKLSASGWDIGKERDGITTGFSGTCDSRLTLPTDVEHLDLPEQKHTNALVLEYLLMPENGVHFLACTQRASSDTDHLLSSIMQLEPPVQVILDVGAQILELDNLDMASTWLGMHDSSKDAAVFVDDNDEICVVDRSGRIELLRKSSYQARLDRCLIFLDEAHTRGIDLQLPATYRAAVTLGPRLTKDRLVQACMRMRKLGKGQTVVFCIPEEVQHRILEAAMKDSGTAIEVSDVLIWAICETHDEIRRSMPLWAVQGERFVRQEKMWREAQGSSGSGSTVMSKDLADGFLEDEAQSLEDRYRPRRGHDRLRELVNQDDPRSQQIASRCRAIDGLKFDSSTLQEEQERELSPEIEQERQVQRAPSGTLLKHELHPDVVKFAMTGELVQGGSKGYSWAFSTLKDTTAGKRFPTSQLKGSRQLLASADFANTVEQRGSSFTADAFLRSVQWVLTSHDRASNTVNRIMVISPYEANLLRPRLSSSGPTTLHVYKARTNSGYAPLDTLSLASVPARSPPLVLPRSLAVQLNLFAGQLYISTYNDYLEICSFLGLSPRTLTEEMEAQGWKVGADGFILSDDQGRVGGSSGLKSSPVSFLKALMTYRRNGDGISKTHMGRLLEGKLFGAADFEQ